MRTIQSLFLASLMMGSVARAEMVLTFGGDVNLNQSRGYISATDTQKWSARATWQSLFAGLVPYLNGHLNFANLETVVSDRTNLPEYSSGDKQLKYIFRAHPQGVEYAAMAGFNIMSLSNNHTGDYGMTGIRETLTHMDRLTKNVDLHVSGLGWTREEALRPTLIPVRTTDGDFTVAFIAMSGVMPYDYRAREDRPGTLSFYTPADFRDAMKALREARADYRILSVHWGREGTVNFDKEQRPWAMRALKDGNVDLFLGHHPHRVHPVERVGDRFIFYSLGNYLMVGGASLDKLPNDSNYGLMGRLYLSYDRTKRRFVPQAVEALPITEMHFKARPLQGAAARARIGALNMHSTNQLGASAMEFTLGEQGGYACLGNDQGVGAKEICKGRNIVSSPLADLLTPDEKTSRPSDEPLIKVAPVRPKTAIPELPVNGPIPVMRPVQEEAKKQGGVVRMKPAVDVQVGAQPVKRPVNNGDAAAEALMSAGQKKLKKPATEVFPPAPVQKVDRRPRWMQKLFGQ